MLVPLGPEFQERTYTRGQEHIHIRFLVDHMGNTTDFDSHTAHIQNQ